MTPSGHGSFCDVQIRFNYRHTADTNSANSTDRREEIEKTKRQGERGRGLDKRCERRADKREICRETERQRACREADRYRDTYRQRQTDMKRQRAGKG